MSPIIIALICVGAFIVLFLGLMLLRAAKIKPVSKGGGAFSFSDPDENIAKRAAESLSKAISFETVNGNTDEFDRFRAFLKERYPLVNSAMSLETTSRGSLIYKWSSGSPDSGLAPVLFCGHFDVVPATGEWKIPPFSGEIDGEFVNGRGAIDCKNVVIGLLEAAETLLSSGFTPARDMYFAFGHDEEIGGPEGASAMARLFEERGLFFDMVLDEGTYITSDFNGVDGNAVAIIAVAEKGLLNLIISASSAGGHSARPPKHSTLGIVSEAACRVEASPMKPVLSQTTRKYFSKIAPTLPFSKRFLIANIPLTTPSLMRWLSKTPEYNALIRSTMAVTMAEGSNAPNVMPPLSKMTVNCRMIQGNFASDVSRHVKSLMTGLDVDISPKAPPVEASKVSDYRKGAFRLLQSAVHARYGNDLIVTPGITLGGTDARYYSTVSDNVIRFMPFVLTRDIASRLHSNDEKVPIRALGAAVECYMSIMKALSN